MKDLYDDVTSRANDLTGDLVRNWFFALLGSLVLLGCSSGSASQACTSLVNQERAVPFQVVTALSKMTGGGTIHDGIYRLTAANFVSYDDLAITPASISAIFQFQNSDVDEVITVPGPPTTTSHAGRATSSVSGSELALTYTCPANDPGGTESWFFSATDSQIVMRFSAYKMWVSIPVLSSDGEVELVLTKQ